MNCAGWQRLVALYVGNDLDHPRGMRVEQHLAACPSCRHLEKELRTDLQKLGELDAAAMEGLELGSVRGAVMANIETRRAPSAMFIRPPLVAALAMAVVVIAFAIVFRQGQGVAPPRTATRQDPSPAPELVAESKPLQTSPPQPTSEIARPIPNPADTRLARAEPSPPGLSPSSVVSVPAEPMTIKILTDDPAVVIYWIVDPKGDEKHV